MVVMILENVPPSVRGELSRWLIQPRAGVFVGKLSAMVRDRLWEYCTGKRGIGGAIQIWSDAKEQGFSLRAHGNPHMSPIDVEGICLMRKPNAEHVEAICNSPAKPG